MNSLRPNSVCDTTPLKRLESQSSCSEPSSPTTFNGGLCVGVTTTTATIAAAAATIANGGCLVGVNGHSSDTTTSSSTTTTSTTLSLNNHHINNYSNNNNNKNEKSLNIFGNSSLIGGSGVASSVLVLF